MSSHLGEFVAYFAFEELGVEYNNVKSPLREEQLMKPPVVQLSLEIIELAPCVVLEHVRVQIHADSARIAFVVSGPVAASSPDAPH